MVMKALLTSLLLLSSTAYGQLFSDDFGTGFASIDVVKWPSACRSGASSFNTSVGACSSAGDYSYSLSGFGAYITTQAITIPAAGYELTFDYSFNLAFSFPAVEIRTGATCGTTLQSTTTLTNTSGVCTPQTIDLSAYSGQTIYIRLKANTSSATTYWDNVIVDLSSGGGGGGGCLLSDDFGTAFTSIDAVNWPVACRGGTASGFNYSTAPCASAVERGYGLNGFGSYITSMGLAIPASGYSLDFDYSFSLAFSFPAIEIRTGGPCGSVLANSIPLTNTSGVCTPMSIDLSAYSGQTIYIRFRSNTATATFYLDEVQVCNSGGGSGIDQKWADNFNDNDLIPDYTGIDGDEDCSGCGNWTLNGGATLELVPAGGWNGNSNETEAFVDNMANVYYAKLDRDEWIESPTIDMSSMSSLKISFYAKSSSAGSGGGDSWSSFSDHLRLDIWDGSAWITVKDITEGAATEENKISPALPFNYFCFSAYNDATSPGNYYYTSTPNVNAAYFNSDFKFRVIFEGGFSGAPFAWVDDFTFRTDDDGYSTMIPCGISFWNQPAATSYGQDPGATPANNAERGVELELDNSINIPPVWASEADDGDVVTQVFGVGESERVVFAVISEQKIQFAFPKVHFYAPDIGNQSSVLSLDNTYSGPGYRYYTVEYISCDLAGGSIAEPTDAYAYHYSFEYGNEFIPVFYQLNTSGIETGGGVTSVFEQFDAPDVNSSDDCGVALGVDLISFDAKDHESFVDVQWSTLSERNSDYFIVEKSTDGETFHELGKIQANGNSSALLNYNFKDSNLDFKMAYYRLRQVDFDGKTEFFGPVVVSRKSLVVYPNPSANGVFYLSDGIAKSGLKITNALGQEMEFSLIRESNSIQLKGAERGIYFLTSTDAMGARKSCRLVVN